MRKQIAYQTYDGERALYHLTETDVIGCVFDGPADGESALKECNDICVKDCSFSLRYPLWHTQKFTLCNSYLDAKTRAPLWYCRDGILSDCTIDGIKTVRECENMEISRCSVHSPEFGWRSKHMRICDSVIESEYFLFECSDLHISRLRMSGKYSFQYVKNATIEDSLFDTKDAFWHCKNMTVKNTTLKGEYLGWYSENLTLINCHIIGTQPLCYCKNLKLIDCTTQGCDRAFEYSDINAAIKGHIHSVENPKSGKIVADSIGEIIRGNEATDCNAQIISLSEK